MAPHSHSRYIESCRPFLIALTFLTTTERPQMSLDKLIAAATDYFLTGAYVHRCALAGGGGKITELSGPATKKVAAKATKTTAAVETPADEPATAAEAAANQAENDAMLAHAAKAAEKLGDPAGGEDDLDGPAISYEEDIRPVLRAKSLANRDALVALLGKFNVKSGQELTADQYPAFLAGLKTI